MGPSSRTTSSRRQRRSASPGASWVGTALLLRVMLGEWILPHEARLRLPATLLVRDSTGPAFEENSA